MGWTPEHIDEKISVVNAQLPPGFYVERAIEESRDGVEHVALYNRHKPPTATVWYHRVSVWTATVLMHRESIIIGIATRLNPAVIAQ